MWKTFHTNTEGTLNWKGCPHCANNIKYTLKTFIKEANIIHNKEYSYFGPYVNVGVKILIRHKKCKRLFTQKPNNHLTGQRCPYCYGTIKYTLKTFIKEANITHNKEYSYFGPYINVETKILIRHKKCGKLFTQKPNAHLFGQCCPHCSNSNISKSEIKWLDKLNIIHRQFEVNNYECDGYDPLTNTIYEYQGSFWHGELKFYFYEDINPRTKTTFSKLYQDTLDRRESLLAMGYNVYEKWSESKRELFFKGKGNTKIPLLTPETIIINY